MARSHYDVLGLAGRPSSYAQEDIKLAYKRALLLHHPDKSRGNSTIFSVDDITQAFRVLSDTHARAEYDRRLALLADHVPGQQNVGHTGLETVDLDDLTPLQEEGEEGEQGDRWSKNCRCGRIYIINEQQLEQEASKGELYVPCDGCSLWLRVLYQLSDG